MAWLAALLLLLRACAVALPLLASFTVTTALAAPVLENDLLHLAAGVLVTLGLPLVLWRGRIRRARFEVFAPVVNLGLAAALAFGFADDVGRALRRHGDWWLGERNGAFARGFRGTVAFAATALERFDPPPEIALAPVPPAQPDQPEAPPPPATPVWVHPLAGPARILPIRGSQRFGAARPQPRPTECELGHCGVDLLGTVGTPVHVIADGVVVKLERDAERGGRAGRYLVVDHVGHGGGAVTSRYIHLDTIEEDLRPGTTLRIGQVIGTLGRSGIHHSAPHLHFGLQVRGTYVDPEPYLRRFPLLGDGPVASLRQKNSSSSLLLPSVGSPSQ